MTTGIDDPRTIRYVMRVARRRRDGRWHVEEAGHHSIAFAMKDEAETAARMRGTRRATPVAPVVATTPPAEPSTAATGKPADAVRPAAAPARNPLYRPPTVIVFHCP
ncbi:hypothetical protein [Dokdonella sp.]|uniref:hypothetical protein n=1 Tax=Dokdonella sp. TaxID=2291710 RepID=UPI003F805CCC